MDTDLRPRYHEQLARALLLPPLVLVGVACLAQFLGYRFESGWGWWALAEILTYWVATWLTQTLRHGGPGRTRVVARIVAWSILICLAYGFLTFLASLTSTR
jgi:hypothetical protein